MSARLSIRILPGELPLDGSLLLVARLLPSVDLAAQELPTGDAPIQGTGG